MNPQIVLDLSRQRTADLLRDAQRRRRKARFKPEPTWRDVVVRVAADGDEAAIERLSQLDGRRPEGRLLVAEVRGEVRAAVAIGSGEHVADPFRPTAALVELLERARLHLRGEGGNGWQRLRSRFRRPLGSGAGRAAPTVPGNETSLIR
jgi:hypothetical protein